MSSDPPHPVPRLVSGALIAELAEVADLHRDAGAEFAIAVVVRPAWGSRPVTLITNLSDAAARRALLVALLAGIMPPGDPPHA